MSTKRYPSGSPDGIGGQFRGQNIASLSSDTEDAIAEPYDYSQVYNRETHITFRNALQHGITGTPIQGLVCEEGDFFGWKEFSVGPGWHGSDWVGESDFPRDGDKKLTFTRTEDDEGVIRVTSSLDNKFEGFRTEVHFGFTHPAVSNLAIRCSATLNSLLENGLIEPTEEQVNLAVSGVVYGWSNELKAYPPTPRATVGLQRATTISDYHAWILAAAHAHRMSPVSCRERFHTDYCPNCVRFHCEAVNTAETIVKNSSYSQDIGSERRDKILLALCKLDTGSGIAGRYSRNYTDHRMSLHRTLSRSWRAYRRRAELLDMEILQIDQEVRDMAVELGHRMFLQSVIKNAQKPPYVRQAASWLPKFKAAADQRFKNE